MFVKANGIDVHYQLEGSPSAPVVTLSNSLAANLSMWEPQMEPLLRSYRVLRYDTRGHGRTEAPDGPYSFDMLASDVRALLSALGIEKTHFLGISMGGMIGQKLALDAPELLHSVILCDTTSRIPPEARPVWDERIRAVQAQGMEQHILPTLERWFTPPFRKSHPEVMERFGAMIRATKPAGYVGCAHAIRDLDFSDQLQRINVPTLIITGAEDPSFPITVSEDLHRRIARSRLVVLKSAAHLPCAEQSERFNEAVLSFLKEMQ
jgi:3-oxoadipate enol-lactonase